MKLYVLIKIETKLVRICIYITSSFHNKCFYRKEAAQYDSSSQAARCNNCQCLMLFHKFFYHLNITYPLFLISFFSLFQSLSSLEILYLNCMSSWQSKLKLYLTYFLLHHKSWKLGVVLVV